MPTTIDITTSVPLIVDEFRRLDELVNPLDSAGWSAATPLPGWTVHDVIAHIIGTESMLAGRANPPAPDSYGDHVRNPIGEANEVWVAHWRHRSAAELLAEFRSITDERTEALRSADQAQFDAESWTPAGDDTYGRFMRIRHFDCYLHELDIRDALGLADPSDAADHVAFTLDEVAPSLGFVVAKRAGVPKGKSVGFRITGPVERRFDVIVEDRAQLADEPVDEPSTTLTMGAHAFLRLIGGRSAFDQHDDEITVRGDTDLGVNTARRLAYTI